MRTTLTIDERLAKDLKRAAHESGKSFKQIVNEALDAGLRALKKPAPRPYRVKPVALGEPRPGYNLDKTLLLADALEDDGILRKLEQRK